MEESFPSSTGRSTASHCSSLQFLLSLPPPKKIPPTIVPGIQPVNQTAKFHEGQSTISRSLCF